MSSAKPVARFAVRTAVGFGLMFAAGKVAQLFLPKRDHPDDDDFEFGVVMGGREYASTATALRAGWAIVVMGGLDLDLRNATLAPGGARLKLITVMGGVRVLVPDTWAVEVESSVAAGNVEVAVPDPVGQGDEAPRLTIELHATLSGALVTTNPDTEAVVAVQFG